MVTGFLHFQLAPPPINEDDARKGILSLIERGLIPPAAQLTLDPSPVRNKMAPLHDPQDKTKPPATPGNKTFELSPLEQIGRVFGEKKDDFQ